MSTAITRKEIIEDEAIKWGEDYVKMLQPAIEKNKEFVDSILALNEANKKLRASGNDKEYRANLKATNEIAEKSVVIWKEQIALENNLISTKRKNELATESTNKALIKERVELGEVNKHIKTLALSNSKLASEYDKITAKARLQARVLQDIQIEGKKAGESTVQYSIRLQQAQIEFDNLQKKVIAANRVIGKYNDNVGNYPQLAIKGIKDLITAFGVVGGLSTFVSITREAFNIVKDFEAEIVNLAAIAGKSREDIAPLESKIREVAKASINGATDVAKLATELIKLGSTPEEAAKLLKPVNDLSIALRASAEDAATLVKSLLNSFQQGADSAGKFTDVLAAGANRSALDFEGLKDALAFVAPSANALGIPLEKTVAIVGTLADNGIKASSAGRLLSTSFITLAKQGKTLEEALSDINRAQAEGKSRLDVLSIAGTLFGAESAKIGLVLANNTEKINESTKAYENSKGSLEELTNKQLKSVSAELKILDSEWEDYILGVNEAEGGSVAMTSALRFLSGNLKTIINLTIYAGYAWIAYKAALILANVQARLFATNIIATNAAQAQNVVVTGFGTAAQLANAEATNVATSSWKKFTIALKENVLGLIVAGLIAVIHYYNKWTDALENNVKNTKSSTDTFLKNRDVVARNGIAIKNLSDRYDELKNKSKLTADEQKELNRIIEILSKNVPGAVSEINKYGEATAINTVKTREFVKAQKELNDLQNIKKLQENKDALKELRQERDRLNVSTDKSKGSIIDEIGYVVKVDGVLKRRNGTLGTYRALTLEEQIIFKKKVAENEKNIAIVENNIRLLSGQSEAENNAAKAAEDSVNKKQDAGKRTIEIIDGEIKALNDSISLLSDKSGKEGNILKKKIEALKAEREQIYSTENADKVRTDNGLKNARKQYDAIYQLSQFAYQNEIDKNQRIIDSDKSTTEQQVNALLDISQLRKSKNEETLQYDLQRNSLEKVDLDKLSKEKFAIYKKDSENRIAQLISGKITVDKMTDEELLIFKKYYAEIEKLRLDDDLKKQALIDSEVAKVQKQIDSENQKANIELNNALKAENDKFLALNAAEKQNQKEREDAIQEHERKILEIKTIYAKKAIQTTIDSLRAELDANEKRPEAERLSAEKIQQIRDQLAAAEVELGNISVENYKKNADSKITIEQYLSQAIQDLQSGLTAELVNFANALFDAKIANIDYEIQKSDEYYNNEIEKAGDDQRKKDILQKEAEKKRAELEKKRRAEQYKQAVFNKAITIAEIGLKTALAVISAAAATAPTFWGVAIAAAIGALQLATAVATPLPKYKDGKRKGQGADGFAWVDDGYFAGRYTPEVIERGNGTVELGGNKPRVTYLKREDIVHKSFDDYKKTLRQSTINDFPRKLNTVREYQERIELHKYDNELLQEMKRNTAAIKKGKPIVIHQGKPIDIPHAIWASKNINWR